MPRSRKKKGPAAEKDRSYIEDIFDSAAHIERYVHGVTFDAFSANEILQDAILRRLTIIGEAAACVSADFRAANPKIDWKNIIAFRHLVVHRYWSVDRNIVWQIALDDVPQLLEALRGMNAVG